MYWQEEQRLQQQQQQQQQHGMHGRSPGGMQQGFLGGFGSPGIGNRPSLLDMGGNLSRSDPGMRSPPYNMGPSPNSLPGSGPRGGLLPSPGVGFRPNQQDMLGILDSDIDELMVAKVRLQQALLSSGGEPGMMDQQARHGFQQQGMMNDRNPRWQQQQQQQQQQQWYPNQDRRGSSFGAQSQRFGGGRDGAAQSGPRARQGAGMNRGGLDGRSDNTRGGRSNNANRDRKESGRADGRKPNSQRKRTSSEIYDPAKPTDDESTSIGRPVDDLQVTIKQQSRGRAVIDEGGPARKKSNMQGAKAAGNRSQGTDQNGDKTSQPSGVNIEAESNSTWFCHVCNVSCRNLKFYQSHMTGKKHMDTMEKIRKMASFQTDQAKARLHAETYLRKLDGGGSRDGGGVGKPRNRSNSGELRGSDQYCRVCHAYFDGERVDHLKSEAHKEAKKTSLPHCKVCNVSFKTSQKYVQHCNSEQHKKLRANKGKKEISTEDKNFVTVDAVGFEDDFDVDAELMEMEMESRNKDQQLENPPKEEEQDIVIVLDSGDEEPSKEQTDSEAAPEDGTCVDKDSKSAQPEPDQQAQQEAKESTDQGVTSEFIDGQQSTVEVLEPSIEPTTEAFADAPEGVATKNVSVCSGGFGSDSKSSMPSLKVTVTFDKQASPARELVSPKPDASLDTTLAGSEGVDVDSKAVAVVGSDKIEDKGLANQVGSDQVGSSEVGESNKGENTAKNVLDQPGESAASKQLQDIDDKQEKQPDIAIELVFDPNKCVGEEYLVPVSGFFCKLCHKFLTSGKASRTHCKGKAHFQALKAELKKAEDECSAEEESSI